MSASAPSQTVFSIGYDFHAGNGTSGSGADNGNPSACASGHSITNYKDTTRNQTFTYDVLNRLTSAQNAGTDCNVHLGDGHTKFWGNSYGYDAWGNLLQKVPGKCTAESLSVLADAKNQVHTGASPDYAYDASGNMTSDVTDGVTASYDAENRISTASKNGVTTTYVYDADGNRVEKTNGTSSTLYWYMTPGIVAESDLTGTLKSEYVFFGGERVARRDLAAPTGVFYYFSDHLKTASVITDATGNIKAESDYYPWGGELQFVSNDSNHYKFTGKERDAESGLDYFGARYYSNGLGRFITPDWSAKPIPVPYAIFGDPQTLNQYSYVRNNPLARADLDGHGWWSDFKEKLVNGWKYGEAVTNANLPAAFAKERQWLINNARNAGGGALTPSQVNGLQGASNQQINGLYKGYANALLIKQQFSLCECAMSTNPQDYQRAADGSLVPLTRLHSDTTITSSNSGSYDFWKGQSTEQIIESLKQGSKFGELTVYPNGTIANGNTRIKILQDRGVDVNKLERVIRAIEEIGPKIPE